MLINNGVKKEIIKYKVRIRDLKRIIINSKIIISIKGNNIISWLNEEINWNEKKIKINAINRVLKLIEINIIFKRWVINIGLNVAIKYRNK